MGKGFNRYYEQEVTRLQKSVEIDKNTLAQLEISNRCHNCDGIIEVHETYLGKPVQGSCTVCKMWYSIPR